MVIQPLLFPPEYLKNEPELFFQGVEAKNNIIESSVSLPAGAELSLGTYFNSFSIGKWMEYTNLNNLSLNLEIKGKIEIKAYHAVGSVDNELLNRKSRKYTEEYINLVNTKAYKAEREEVYIQVTQENNIFTVKFPHLYENGILYITIRAISDVSLYGGAYLTENDESILNPVKIAVGICTFKREEAVMGNVARMFTDIINNPQSPLSDKLEIYIADNGHTLLETSFQSDKVHIFPNPNLGGSGGFTRTMIEAMLYDGAKAFSHIIFMDDDILLYTAVLERTYYLLRLMKSEYHKAILGAATLLQEKPYIQQESGALYRDKTFYIGRANHKFFDLRKLDAVVANEATNPTNYTGWWYACIPQTIVNEHNLPMPFFIHYDDVEYGIRNIENSLLFINGICVWHPSPKGKSPFWMTYYNVRNRLITMFSKALDKSAFSECLFRISRQFLLRIISYDYEYAKLIMAGLQDFLNGPEAFERLDAAELHKKLVMTKDIFLTPEEVGISREQIIDENYPNFKKAVVIQILYNMLPAKKNICAINSKYFNIPYKAEVVYLYNETIDKGTMNKRNQKEFFRLLFAFLKVRRELKSRYEELLKDWQDAKHIFTSLSFWERYLRLK